MIKTTTIIYCDFCKKKETIEGDMIEHYPYEKGWCDLQSLQAMIGRKPTLKTQMSRKSLIYKEMNFCSPKCIIDFFEEKIKDTSKIKGNKEDIDLSIENDDEIVYENNTEKKGIFGRW